MNKQAMVAAGVASVLTAVALHIPDATAKESTSTSGNVVCSGWIPESRLADFIEAQLAAGRTNIEIEGGSNMVVCAW